MSSNFIGTLARCRIKGLNSPVKFNIEYQMKNGVKPDVRICCSFTK